MTRMKLEWIPFPENQAEEPKHVPPPYYLCANERGTQHWLY